MNLEKKPRPKVNYYTYQNLPEFHVRYRGKSRQFRGSSISYGSTARTDDFIRHLIAEFVAEVDAELSAPVGD